MKFKILSFLILSSLFLIGCGGGDKPANNYSYKECKLGVLTHLNST